MTGVEQTGSAANSKATTDYNALGQITHIGFYNGGILLIDKSIGYYNDNRPDYIIYQRYSDNLSVSMYAWTMDAADRINGLTWWHYNTGPDDYELNDAHYTYDAQDQVTSVDNELLGDESYAYDANG